jgi:hypothetical protein
MPATAQSIRKNGRAGINVGEFRFRRSVKSTQDGSDRIGQWETSATSYSTRVASRDLRSLTQSTDYLVGKTRTDTGAAVEILSNLRILFLTTCAISAGVWVGYLVWQFIRRGEFA